MGYHSITVRIRCTTMKFSPPHACGYITYLVLLSVVCLTVYTMYRVSIYLINFLQEERLFVTSQRKRFVVVSP